MKLVLAEDRSGVLHGERSLTSEAIFVGRDPAVCHYFFSQEQWPMVSRKHAEFRLSDRRYLVADSNSRFGTFVNGQRITEPVEVRVGSQVQLGTGGPILRVISIEQAAVARPEPKGSELGRMDTLHEPSPGAAPPQSPSMPTPTPPSMPAANTNKTPA